MRRALLTLSAFAVIAVLAAAAPARPLQAQELDGGPDASIGTIPGTSMLREEFRARARVQLTAIAMNAFVHRQIYQEYPETLYDLYNSEAWNLDILNMFSGEPVDAVLFEPESKDMTTQPYLELPYNFSVASAPPIYSQGPGAEGLPPTFEMGSMPSVRDARVDPTRIESWNAGDVFYYVNGDMLQLVVWAPDGTYQELVHEVPNPNWSEALSVNSSDPMWPENLLLAQSAFYVERELPQSYNLVRFMSDEEPLPVPQLERAGVQQRFDMASEMDIVILNPLSKAPAEVVGDESPGDFFEPNPEQPIPVQMFTSAGQLATLANLRIPGGRTTAGSGSKPAQQEKAGGAKPVKKPSRPKNPPLGGKRG